MPGGTGRRTLEGMADASKIAEELAAAERDRRHGAPFSDDLDLDTAYEAQWQGVQAKLAAGETLVGASSA